MYVGEYNERFYALYVPERLNHTSGLAESLLRWASYMLGIELRELLRHQSKLKGIE